MKGWKGNVRNDKGVALPLALFALVMLSGLLLVLVAMGGIEPTVAANLDDVTRARYLADAGLEWAFDQLVQQAPACWSTVPSCWSNILATNNGTMATNLPLTGLPATAGTFSVRVRNDNLAGDDKITGQPVDPGGPTSDTNNVVIVVSTGTYNGVTRQLQRVLSHPYVTLPGGLNLPGVPANTNFSGNAFTITGNDTNVDGTPGTCASVWGIGVGNSTTQQIVKTSLSAQQQNDITGKPINPGPGAGTNTIAVDPSLTSAKIAKFVSAVKPVADMSLQIDASHLLQVQNLGSTCASNLNDPTCWGTPANPKIVYIKGTTDPAQSYYAVTISGNSTGAGILIVENGDVKITGNFNWQGLILITGQYVGLYYGGGGWQSIYGGMVVNETADVASDVEFDTRGNTKLLYSCQALNNVFNQRRLFRTTSWREL